MDPFGALVVQLVTEERILAGREPAGIVATPSDGHAVLVGFPEEPVLILIESIETHVPRLGGDGFRFGGLIISGRG